MSLNLLVSIIIYALMAFFVGCGFYHIVNLTSFNKRTVPLNTERRF